jgi:hypothetical protein
VANTYDDYMDISGVVFSLEAQLEFLDLNSNRALVGVIKLNRKEYLLIA